MAKQKSPSAEQLARAKRVQHAKDVSSLTWEGIADACGVGTRSPYHWLEGKKMTYPHARALARATGVDVDWLWRGEQNGETTQMDRVEAMLEVLLGSRSQEAADWWSDVEAHAERARQRRRDRERKADESPG